MIFFNLNLKRNSHVFQKKTERGKRKSNCISFGQKIGIVCLRSLEKYIAKNKIIKCYIIASLPPHQNVVNYAQNINLLEIIISSNFRQEIEKVRKLYKDTPIKIIDLANFGEADAMRDPC